MTAHQLPLPLPEIDPRDMQAAARRLGKLVRANRRSFALQDSNRRRAAMLKHTRPALNQGEK